MRRILAHSEMFARRLDSNDDRATSRLASVQGLLEASTKRTNVVVLFACFAQLSLSLGLLGEEMQALEVAKIATKKISPKTLLELSSRDVVTATTPRAIEES